jgi:hypothetical protein
MATQTSAAEIARARALLGAEVTERDFQGEVLAAAKLLGWRTFHVLDSRGSAAGFPDVVAVRGARLIMAELKREKGTVTADQQAWLDALERVQTLDTHLWRPSDWSAVEEALR